MERRFSNGTVGGSASFLTAFFLSGSESLLVLIPPRAPLFQPGLAAYPGVAATYSSTGPVLPARLLPLSPPLLQESCARTGAEHRRMGLSACYLSLWRFAPFLEGRKLGFPSQNRFHATLGTIASTHSPFVWFFFSLFFSVLWREASHSTLIPRVRSAESAKRAERGLAEFVL